MTADAVNAAWRLGFRALPPSGSVVRVRFGERLDVFKVIVANVRGAPAGYKSSCRSGLKRKRAIAVKRAGSRFEININDIVEFVSVPASAPPLSEWETP